MTLAIWKEEYLLKTLAKVSSLTSFPRLPQNTRQSFSGQSSMVLSSQTSPAAFRRVLFQFFSYFLIFLLFCPLTSSSFLPQFASSYSSGIFLAYNFSFLVYYSLGLRSWVLVGSTFLLLSMEFSFSLSCFIFYSLESYTIWTIGWLISATGSYKVYKQQTYNSE